MCGIYGIFGEENSTLIEAMSSDMRRRGPDAKGFFLDKGISLGMNRLHIWGEGADLVPFKLLDDVYGYNGEVYGCFNEDGTYIDNQAGGIGEIHFMSANDYSTRLDGMYALAHYDLKKKQLNLFRDIHGIKPIFYTEQDNKVLFGSSIRTLVRQSRYALSFDQVSLFQIFAFGYPLTDQTAYQMIKELRPGTSLHLGKNGLHCKDGEYYCQKALGTDFDTLRQCIRRSVSNCQKGIEKIGLAISGGVDSTILAYELNDMGVEDLQTFSVILGENGDGVRDLKELGFAPGGAWTKWKHHYVEIDAENFAHHLRQSLDHFFYPTDMHSIPLYNALAELVSTTGIKVLLTGEGVDEHFMGYGKYRSYRGLPHIRSFYMDSLKGQFIEQIFDRKIVDNGLNEAENFSEGYFWEKIKQVEIRCRLQKLLHRTDVILMEHSIEGRTPFLHGQIPDFASGISPAAHIGKLGKEVIRQAYQNLIPGIINKEKKRFKASGDLFLKVFQHPSVRELIYSPMSVNGLRMNEKIIDRIYKAYPQDKTGLSELLYLILTTKHIHTTLK